MSYFVGLDVALRSLALCVIDCNGKIVLERALDCEVEAIVSCLTKFGHPVQKVGFEAGTMSQALFYGLQAAGYDVVCMEARHVSAALSAMRNKTDKNDARSRGCVKTLFCDMFLVIESEVYRETLYPGPRPQPVDIVP